MEKERWNTILFIQGLESFDVDNRIRRDRRSMKTLVDTFSFKTNNMCQVSYTLIKTYNVLN